MKFSFKIVIGTTIIIATLFSAGGTYMVEKNFKVAFDNATSSNTKEHILSRYSLEANVRNAVEGGKKLDDKLIKSYAIKMQGYGNQEENMMIYTDKQDIYSNIDAKIFHNLKEYLNSNDTYRLYKHDDNTHMVIASQLVINDYKFTLLNTYDITDVFSEKHRQLIMLMRIDIFIIMSAIICVYVMSRYLTANIKKLTITSKCISEGNYAERTHIDSNDEIGELSTNFDIMAQAIEEHIEKLRLDVCNREDFVSDFSHELKTPMTAMMGYSKMLKDGEADAKTRDKAVNYIYKECKRLEILSRKLLLLMGISDDKLMLSKVYCKWLGEQIREAVTPCIGDVELSIDLQESCIIGDASLLIDLFKNLIENSARACDKHDGRISLTGRILSYVEKDVYVFKVIDNGVGIPEDELDKITRAFYMVDKSRSRATGGSGLGLSICDKICRLHNTTMRIKSIVSQGTTVEIEVDFAKED